jgi:hypothetical protein
MDLLNSLLTIGLCSTGYALHLKDATDGGAQGEIHGCEKEGGKGMLSSHKRPISEFSSMFRSFNYKT